MSHFYPIHSMGHLKERSTNVKKIEPGIIGPLIRTLALLETISAAGKIFKNHVKYIQNKELFSFILGI